jgi:hypothetical protein
MGEVPGGVETHQAGLGSDENAVGGLPLLQVGEGDGSDSASDGGLTHLEQDNQ